MIDLQLTPTLVLCCPLFFCSCSYGCISRETESLTSTASSISGPPMSPRLGSMTSADLDLATMTEVSGREEFLKAQVELYRDGPLHPGEHEFPFTFPLSRNLPGSVQNPSLDGKGTAGVSVLYTVRVSLHRGYLKFPIEKTIPVTIRQAPLTIYPAHDPFIFTHSTPSDTIDPSGPKSPGRGSISSTVCLAQTIAVPGSSLSFDLSIRNRSAGAVTGITTHLRHSVTLVSMTPSFAEKSLSFSSARETHPGRIEHGKKGTATLDLSLPSTLPLDVTSKHALLSTKLIIGVQYEAHGSDAAGKPLKRVVRLAIPLQVVTEAAAEAASSNALSLELDPSFDALSIGDVGPTGGSDAGSSTGTTSSRPGTSHVRSRSMASTSGSWRAREGSAGPRADVPAALLAEKVSATATAFADTIPVAKDASMDFSITVLSPSGSVASDLASPAEKVTSPAPAPSPVPPSPGTVAEVPITEAAKTKRQASLVDVLAGSEPVEAELAREAMVIMGRAVPSEVPTPSPLPESAYEDDDSDVNALLQFSPKVPVVQPQKAGRKPSVSSDRSNAVESVISSLEDDDDGDDEEGNTTLEPSDLSWSAPDSPGRVRSARRRPEGGLSPLKLELGPPPSADGPLHKLRWQRGFTGMTVASAMKRSQQDYQLIEGGKYALGQEEQELLHEYERNKVTSPGKDGPAESNVKSPPCSRPHLGGVRGSGETSTAVTSPPASKATMVGTVAKRQVGPSPAPPNRPAQHPSDTGPSPVARPPSATGDGRRFSIRSGAGVVKALAGAHLRAKRRVSAPMAPASSKMNSSLGSKSGLKKSSSMKTLGRAKAVPGPMTGGIMLPESSKGLSRTVSGKSLRSSKSMKSKASVRSTVSHKTTKSKASATSGGSASAAVRRRSSASSRPKLNPVLTWNVDEVAGWLRGLKLESLVPVFTSNEIRGPSLVSLTREDLHEMGVTKIGPIKEVLSAVAELKGR